MRLQLTGQHYDRLSSRPLTGGLHYSIVEGFLPSPVECGYVVESLELLHNATTSELHIGPGNSPLKLVVAIDIRGKRGEILDWAEWDNFDSSMAALTISR